VRCRVYYQGENNAGGLHGNAGTKDQPPSGYACMMPKLVSLFRKEWSKEPGTTEPTAAFGIVPLSSHDSEGAKDMASFRCKPYIAPLRDCCNVDVSSDGRCMCDRGAAGQHGHSPELAHAQYIHGTCVRPSRSLVRT